MTPKAMKDVIEEALTKYANCNTARKLRAALEEDLEDLDQLDWVDVFYAGMCWRAAYGAMHKQGNIPHEQILKVIGNDPMPMTEECWRN